MDFRKLTLGLSLAAGVAFAATDPDGMDNFSLADLMNLKLQTGSFLELDLSKSPVSMTIIDRDKLKLSGARTLTEALEVYVPGFQYMFNKWNGTLWGMRGVANDRNSKFIFLVNGHKMNTEARDGAFQETELGLLGDIQRVEVLRGPAGLVYGSGAIAGIVNVVTREATQNSTEIVTDMGTGGNFAQKSWGIQAMSFSTLGEGKSLVTSMGYRQDDGLGNGVSRLFGQASWPGTATGSRGAPADGSYGYTPGNWRLSTDWRLNNFRLYARATHQVTEAGGFFVLDPWPEIAGKPDSTAPNRNADGKTVAWNDKFWSTTESGNCSRREYVADNIMADATYQHSFDEDQIKYHLAFDGNTDRIQHQMRPGYESAAVSERNSVYDETFGERRYTLGATYMLKRIPKLQLAVGAEQRFDDIGEDLSGKNEIGQNPKHLVVANILYTNTAVFTEGFYDIAPNMGVDFGLRWDGHTRTIDNGGTTNGKLALVYTPAQGHTVKLIAQSSSNNGSADNYEYGRNNLNDEGVPATTAHYEKPHELPGGNSNAIAGVTTDQLHELKPEKVYSFELTSVHQITPEFQASPSISYNMVQDLFAWNQGLFRVVNAGAYNHLDMEFEASYSNKYVTLGMNHALQVPINTDVDAQATTFIVDKFTKDSVDALGNPVKDNSGSVIQLPNYSREINGKDTTYTPVKNGTKQYVVNPVAEQISADGKNFLSLATNMTKLYMDVHPLPWVALHTDARVFWSLAGRDSIYKAEDNASYNSLGVSANKMVKLDASILFSLPSNLTVSFYVYNILASTNPGSELAINSLRWQQRGTPDQNDLYSLDYRSFAMKMDKSF
jgi:outer membrane receptor protein involved in Fe transport